MEEQQAIVAFLDRHTRVIQPLLRTVETQLARLQEYRSALIVATVTRGCRNVSGDAGAASAGAAGDGS
jgi:hypothetical protein